MKGIVADAAKLQAFYNKQMFESACKPTVFEKLLKDSPPEPKVAKVAVEGCDHIVGSYGDYEGSYNVRLSEGGTEFSWDDIDKYMFCPECGEKLV